MQDAYEGAGAGLQGEKDQTQQVIKLDYTIQEPEERVKLVQKIVDNTPQERLTNRYLQILADYIVFAMDKEQKKQKKINTQNRMVTINKRETSFQGLISKFENGEDGIYNMIINDKNVLLTPKIQITQEDIDTIPPLKQLRDAIAVVQAQEKKATGKKKFLLKKQLIEMRQDQYVIKSAYKPPIYSFNLIKSFPSLDLTDRYQINENGDIVNKGLISFFNPTHISVLLCNYSKIKEGCYGNFNSDIYYMMMDLEDLVDSVLKEEYPLYFDILVNKIGSKTNLEIQQIIQEKYGTTYSVEYISSLWRKKIPKLLADRAEKDALVWYYTEKEKGKWKKCSRCGQIKLAHNKFFSKNNTSKDGFYSICKDCRNGKTKK